MNTCSAIIAAALAVPVAAQWSYPTSGIPRTADGKPNLSAPAPRTADGHPDFSGTWDVEHNKPCPPEGCVDFYVPQEFGNIGWALKDGLPLQPWARELAKSRTLAQRKDDPLTHCLPIGIVELHTIPMYRKIAQVPGLLVVIHEYNASYRQIFMDGRSLPVDPQPSWNGYSTAKWEGDTLTVRTIGFRDDLWMDMAGTPLTGAATVIERFRRPNFGTLEIEAQVDDPKAYTKPWSFKMIDKIVLDTELIDEVCLENENSARHMKPH